MFWGTLAALTVYLLLQFVLGIFYLFIGHLRSSVQHTGTSPDGDSRLMGRCVFLPRRL